MTIRGYSTQEKEERLSAEFATVEPVKTLQFGLSTVAHQFVFELGTDTAEAGSTTKTINATAHIAQKGDVILFTSGVCQGCEVRVWEALFNSFSIAETLPATPSAGDGFKILRHKHPSCDSTGAVNVNTTIVEQATAADGGALPALLKVAGGYDGAAVQVLKTDANGELQVDVLSSVLPVGAATEATLATIDADTSSLASCVGGTELQVDIVSSALPSGAATESTLSTLNGKVTACNTGAVTISSSALPTGAATEATLATIDADTGTIAACVTANKVQVDIVSSALPTGAATESTLSTLNGKITACNTGAVTVSSSALPTGAATEATLATIDADTGALAGCVGGTEIQADIVAPLPAGTNTIGAVNVNTSSVVDFIDTTPVLDCSSTNIPASASTPVTIVASLAAAVKKVQFLDTTGEFIGLYADPAGTPVLKAVFGPGSDQTIEVAIPAATVLGLRNMANSAIASGKVCINFIG